jgi:hypothetical protein
MLNLNHQDIEISTADIQQLSSPNALTAFFATLGYDTNHRLSQTTAAMGITADSLTSNIMHIERIASQDSDFFPLEIYLFQLKTITISATQALARAFRDRQGDYLLVLTDSHDFDRLDFVLVERYRPDSSTTSSSPLSSSSSSPLPASSPSLPTVPTAPRSVAVRPRVLTVNRRQPDLISLRVLRRFTYTESDTLAQFDKLLSAYDVADWSEPYFNNRALFSDYYLTRRLPETPLWHSPTEASALTRAFRSLRVLYDGIRDTVSNRPTPAVRDLLIQPVLSALGFSVQPAQSTQPARDATATATITIEPHYRLYASIATSSVPTQPLALCLAYTWNRSLDGKDDRDDLSPDENPGASVVTLLDRAEAPWAIVTNGKLWRLYSASAHSRATNYYEIDLEETLALPPANLEDAFRYFWFLFRAAAFVPTGATTSFLDTLITESERYARELGDRLKERVFEDIFPHFARGFILHARQHDQLPANLTDLDASERTLLLEPYFSATLTFLYRLLFLLYAESRDLLPVRELRGYFPTSLERLKQQIADNAGPIVDSAPVRLDNAYSNLSTALYDRLQALFHAIDKGDSDLNVPVYNGGLFLTNPDPNDASPEAAVARFLATYKIPDLQLALGLDRMARDEDEKRHDLVFIDYKSLGVRQLGSIYEGLLEFKLRIAPVAMVVVKGKKTEEIIPYTEAQRTNRLARNPRTFPVGHVYLENDRRERKATGSYYTPDYIVKYIVAHTVGPVLRDKLEALRPLFREAEQALRLERDKARALKRSDVSPEHETYKKYRQLLNEAFFDLTVLDPAMGSGHFLVEAVDYITDRLADFLASFRWNPIVYELSLTRQSIQQDMERQGVTIDASKLTDLNLLKRQVLKRCIYGVDLNPMAVELAKVSLWLDCFTLGAPLSFLDHHMKHGNSLIGSRIDEARTAIEQGQLSFFGSNLWAGALLATESMIEIGRLSDVTEEQVRESKLRYHAATDALAPFKRILDVYVSRWFGNEPGKGKQGKAAIDKAIDFLRSTEAQQWYEHPEKIERLNIEQHTIVAIAMQAVQKYRFFHWELEFPEVFFAPAPSTTQSIQPKSNPGFDAVIGNPPYVDLKGMNPVLVDYYFKVFPTAENRLNIFAFFTEQAISLARDGNNGYVGLIIPTVLLVQESYQKIRELLLKNTSIMNIIRLPSELFGEAAGQVKVDTMVLCLNRGLRPDNLTSLLIYSGFNRIDNISAKTASISISVSQSLWQQNPSSVINLAVGSFEGILLEKLKSASQELQALCEFCLGLTPYDKYVGHTEEQIQSRAFHSTHCLGSTYKRLLLSGDVDRYVVEWNGEEWINYGEWLAAPREPRFFQEKHILVNQIIDWTTRRMKACITYEELYNTQNAFNLLPYQEVSLEYILALLNSKLMNFVHEKLFLDEAKMRFQKVLIKDARKFPIRRITFTLTPDQRTSYLDHAKNLYSSYLADHDQQPILAFVDHHLTQHPEQSDVVHDLLAYLAEEMIRLNKEKRASMQQFLSWLESALHILPDREGRVGIDVLTGKSKLLDFPGDYQKGEHPLTPKEIEDILQKNKNKLGISLNDSALIERIKREYESSLHHILPLKDRLQQTDRLIDAVVYRLYGLTEEEIAVVEGRG